MKSSSSREQSEKVLVSHRWSSYETVRLGLGHEGRRISFGHRSRVCLLSDNRARSLPSLYGFAFSHHHLPWGPIPLSAEGRLSGRRKTCGTRDGMFEYGGLRASCDRRGLTHEVQHPAFAPQPNRLVKPTPTKVGQADAHKLRLWMPSVLRTPARLTAGVSLHVSTFHAHLH